MFDREEAIDFIQNVLHVADVEKRLQTGSKAQLLNDIQFGIVSKIPFQNIILLCVPPNERRKPTLAEMKANFVSGIGGMCCDMNQPYFYLLTAIGYDVCLLHGTVWGAGSFYRDAHGVLLAKNLDRQGDSYLLDIASGNPTFTAINLDFEKESPVYVDSHLEYKFLKIGREVLRLHGKGDPLVAKGVKENDEREFWLDGWRRYFSVGLDVEIRDPSKFEEYHREVYVNPTLTPFHTCLTAMRYPNRKTIMVYNTSYLEDVKGDLESTKMSEEDLKSRIQEICPPLPKEWIDKAFVHWKETTNIDCIN